MTAIDKKNQRRSQVLSHIVHLYVTQAAPVSSKSVARSMGDNVSSATVRNIMGDLEGLDYIEQPHTSAGRVPTDHGYRYYVDNIIDKLIMEKMEMERLTREYDERVKSINDIIQKTSNIISQRLHHAGIVMWPGVEDLYLKHLELLRLKSKTVLAVLVTTTNAVKNYIIKLDREIEKKELDTVTNYVNTNFEDQGLLKILDNMNSAINMSEDQRGDDSNTERFARRIINNIMDTDLDNEVYWEGLNYFIEEPEFDNVKSARGILDIFADRKVLAKIMRKDLAYRGIKVYIGEENEPEAFHECSVITAGYDMYGRTIGRIGVIGPMRMDYSNVLSTVSCLSNLISKKLEEFCK